MHEDFLKIPKERVAVLIGNRGETKKSLEKLTKTKIIVDSSSGEVEVKAGDSNAIGFYNALKIVKAIGRGFSPKNAFLLNDEQYFLELIDLKELLGKSGKSLQVKKGRVIGKKGKTRNEIEDKTGCIISVYGKTVAIIGKMDEIDPAKEAVEMLLNGVPHKAVEDFLARKTFSSGKRFEL